MSKITLTNVNVDQLKDYLKEVNIGSSQSLEFTKEGITARAYPKSKELIKYKFLNTDEIYDGGEKIDGMLLLPLMNLSKLIDAFTFFNDGTATMVLSHSDGYIASITISNGVHTFTNKSSDKDLVVTPLPKDRWENFKSDDGVFLKVSLTKERISQIIKLNEIAENKDGHAVIVMTETGLKITNKSSALEDVGNKWEYDVPEDSISLNNAKIDDPMMIKPRNLKLINDEEIILTAKPLSVSEDNSKVVLNFCGDESSSLVLVAMINQ